MQSIIRQLGKRVLGVLSGFDRLLFRGFLRCVINPRGLNGYLFGAGIRMADFKEHALEVTGRLIEESTRQAREGGREIKYLENSAVRKKDVAWEIAQRNHIDNGLICVLKCVEPCTTLRVRGNRATKTIAIQRERTKCLHLYHYFNHSQFGLMHVRLQTWFPFTMQVCLNGREWLARDLTKAGIGYLRHDNCIYRAEDLDAAQRLLDAQLDVSWTTLLRDLARQVHPAHESIFANCPAHARDYYWTVAESEWASDILFHDPADVLPLCERLAAYSMSVHGPGDVMRFFGRTVRADGRPRVSFRGTIQSDVRLFEQGLRLKHWLNGNSEKMYNKPGASALRFEATINNPEEFKAFRTPENAPPDAKPEWLPVRKGVADLYRRAQVSQASNERFAAAQAAVLSEDATPLKQLVASLCQRIVRPGREKSDGSRTRSRTFRALNPLSPEDVHLLTLVSQPKFGISGMRNQDLRPALYYDAPTDPKEQRRQASAVSRKLALLRAHGILEKISKSHRYRLTEKGKHGLTALLAAANAPASKLTSLAV
jgi:hypothetical protein